MKTTLRRTAREAVIAVLLTPILAAAGLLALGTGAIEATIYGVIYGSILGFGLWVLYRLIRFAVKG